MKEYYLFSFDEDFDKEHKYIYIRYTDGFYGPQGDVFKEKYLKEKIYLHTLEYVKDPDHYDTVFVHKDEIKNLNEEQIISYVKEKYKEIKLLKEII